MTYKTTNSIQVLYCIVLSVIISWNVSAQCPPGRFLFNLYSFERDTIYYGSNTNVLGDTVDLYMDIYFPQDDSFERRPVIIFAFGGGFVSGERNDYIMTSLCQGYAQKGYVTATIDYRLFPNEELGAPDSLELIDANVKAVSDMKAAIRFFRQSAENGNPYQVDPDFIVVGGYSAGAFTALHHTYLDEQDQIPNYIEDIIEVNGGFQGNTGDDMNQQYDSGVNACINFAGALYDTTFLNEGESPVFSYHGTEDDVVPISTGMSVNTVATMGSELITKRAINENVDNVFYPVQGAGHVNIWLFVNELNAFFSETNTVLRDMYCSSVTATDHARIVQKIKAFPNPTSGRLELKLADRSRFESDYRVISITGNCVMQGTFNHPNPELDLSHLQSGMYWIKIPGYESQKIIVK